MDHLTIDASVALKFILDEKGSQDARQFHAQDDNGRILVRNILSSPALMLLEVHSTLARKFREDEIDFSTFLRAPHLLKELIAFDDLDCGLIEITRGISLLAHSWSGRNPTQDIQAMSGFSIYDCVYIAHALKYKTTLVTTDRTQAEIARKAFAIPVHMISLSV